MDSLVPSETRSFTVNLPERLAAQAEELAREGNRDISELFGELLRAYQFLQLERKLPALRPPHNPSDDLVTEDDIEAMVDEVRSVTYRVKSGR